MDYKKLILFLNAMQKVYYSKTKSTFPICLLHIVKNLFRKYYLNIYRIHFHRFQVQIQPMMLNHTITEHLPQDVAAELRQCGVDEQVLLVQCFCQRAARTGVFFLYPRVPHETGDYLQRTDRFIQFGCRLFYFFSAPYP